MRPAQDFFESKIRKIISEKQLVVDIGGSLRIDSSKNNRHVRNEWIRECMAAKGTTYKILDKVSDYNPDIVGDIHSLPLEDNSVDAIICMAVLEHVESPIKAMEEMYRVLKPGGYLYLYVPFLYYYHPMKDYYGDFYRFTYDGVQYLTKDFTLVEIQNVHGAFATVMNLLPFFSKRTQLFQFIDWLTGKESSKQTSGYNVFCVK